MDDQEPTAWEEINPAATALAPRPERLPACSERLRPASRETFRNELGACLALVVPVGMDEEARVEWLAVAWQTLSHLPADMLQAGCAKARLTADHPSKIVPAIVAETQDWYEMRQRTAAPILRGDQVPPERQLEKPDYCTPEQARAIMEEFGLRRDPLETARQE